MKICWLMLAGLALPVIAGSLAAGERDKVRVVIIDGQNNHDWRSTTPFMKKALESCGRFTVDVATTPQKPSLPPEPVGISSDDLTKYAAALAKYADDYAAYRLASLKFHPDLTKYDVVLSNYNGASWPKAFNDEFDARLKEGKIGLVIVHAANNSFGSWKEYNQMIGMGWRDKNYGKRLKVDDEGKEIFVPAGQDGSTSHAYTGPFTVVVRDRSHPITKGMPDEWLHAQDELYDNLRGPIENVHLLATAIAPVNAKTGKRMGTGVHEPMIFTIKYGNGRVFHTPMGHDLNGMRCVGFIATLNRGTEWAATGQVTLPLPENFPRADKVVQVPVK